jgi:hypothetical protein
VLVDDALATRARCELPSPRDTIGSLEQQIASRRLSSQALALVPPLAEAGSRPRPRLGRGPSKRVVAGSVVVGLVAALLVGVNVDFRGMPAGADSTVLDSPVTRVEAPAEPARTGLATQPPARPKPRPSAAPSTERNESRSTGRPSPRRSAPAARPSGQRFAWAPVAEASGYHVEFFRGTVRIYARNTARAELELPRTWRFAGKMQELRPGAYRWYVWPIEGTRRAAQATVQAKLVVG